MHPSRLEPRGCVFNNGLSKTILTRHDHSHDYKFIGLNYSFTLNGDQLLDAQNVGNEIRFLNHAPAEVENVEVKCMSNVVPLCWYARLKVLLFSTTRER